MPLAVNRVETLTPGVERTGGDLVHVGLGIRLQETPDAAELAADLGLVSTRFQVEGPRDAPGVLVVRGLSCHLVPATGGRVRDVWIALAGALAPVLGAVAVLLLIAIAHVVVLLFPVGDGAAVRELLR